MSTSSSDSGGSAGRKKIRQGERFERLTAHYFEQHGFQILERNWRAGHKEIDLIVRRDRLIAFVEVKSTFTDAFGHPAERIDPRKIKNLTEAAQRYLADHEISDCDLRFDVVTFVDGHLEHFPNAFPVE